MRRKTLTRSKPIPVQLDEPLRDRIAAASERLGEPKSTVMRMAMRIGLQALEKAVVTEPGKLSNLVHPVSIPGLVSSSKIGAAASEILTAALSAPPTPPTPAAPPAAAAPAPKAKRKPEVFGSKKASP